MSLGRNTKSKKQEREDTLSECVNKSVPQELDVVDKGDHLKVKYWALIHDMWLLFISDIQNKWSPIFVPRLYHVEAEI